MRQLFRKSSRSHTEDWTRGLADDRVSVGPETAHAAVLPTTPDDQKIRTHRVCVGAYSVWGISFLDTNGCLARARRRLKALYLSPYTALHLVLHVRGKHHLQTWVETRDGVDHAQAGIEI